MRNPSLKRSMVGHWILAKVLRENSHFSFLGDFEEIYSEIAREEGVLRAFLWYWGQIIRSLPPYVLNMVYWRVAMLKNTMKITYRNIMKEKGYSFINISGLTIGMACTILILLWVKYEIGYDKFHKNAEHIHRVIFTNDKREWHGEFQPGPLAAYLKDEYPEIVKSTNFGDRILKQIHLTVDEKSFLCDGGYVDPSFFEMFTFPFIKGDPKTAFSNPTSIVITEEVARKFFGSDDPIGKIISRLTVTGVLQSIPQNSSIQFDFLIPFEIAPQWMNAWDNKTVQTYVMLQKNVSSEEISDKISGVMLERNPSWENILYLQPFKRIHLYALAGGGRITTVTIFSAMAFVILMIASINFMNLSTARSEKRFKEIGIKKVVGSSRFQLAKQFLAESILLSFLSLVFAIVFVILLLPPVRNILGIRLVFHCSGSIILGFMGIALATGLIAGSYPALYLSALRPTAVLKGQLSFMPLIFRRIGKASGDGPRISLLRRILVVTQFSLSIVFIICVIVISNQLDYIRNKDLGYDKEHIVVLRTQGRLERESQTLKNELLQNPNILSAAVSMNRLASWDESSSVEWTGKMPNQNFDMGRNLVDYDFLETFKMEMAQGRFFSREFSTDASGAWVLNEAAVKTMGLKSPVGEEIIWSPGSSYEQTGTIIGVIKDFHTESLHGEIRPFMLFFTETGRYMCIRIKPDNISETLHFMEIKIKELVPDDPVSYHFLNEQIDNLYRSEKITSKLLLSIALLAIFISCLGLFSLASFSVERRTKDIGIRKVMGASVLKIVFLLTKEFTKWVLIANLIAWPAAWLAMEKWLQNFAYRIHISWWVFTIAGAIALVIALLTVSYQSIKAAVANPVDSLRYE